jgi:prepilin peptidase CpaA
LKNAMLQFPVLASGLAVAVVTDVRTRRIPNWLTGSLAVAGVGLAFAGGPLTPGQAALGLIAGLLLMMPSHLIGATGAGDVKLMAAIGTLLGPGLVLRAFLFTAVAGGVLAVAVAARRGRLGATLLGTAQLVTARTDARQTVEAPHRANRFAYGPAIAIGTLVSIMVTS